MDHAEKATAPPVHDGSSSNKAYAVVSSEQKDIGADDGGSFPQGSKLILLTCCLCFGTLLVSVDTMILAVAIPQISTEFRALDDVGWYGSAYLLTITAAQPSIGNIYKYFDIKATYLISIVVL